MPSTCICSTQRYATISLAGPDPRVRPIEEGSAGRARGGRHAAPMAPSGAEARFGEGVDAWATLASCASWRGCPSSSPARGCPGRFGFRMESQNPMSHDPSEGARPVFALTAHGLGRLMWSGQLAESIAELETCVPKAALGLADFFPRRWSSAPDEAVGRSRSRAELPKRPIGWSSGRLPAFGGA